MTTITWVKTAIEEDGVGLADLATRYAGSFPAGTPALEIQKAIVKANGVSWSSKAIDDWVFAKSNTRFPYNPKSPSPTPGKGWATFKRGNVILLPGSESPAAATTGAAGQEPVKVTYTTWPAWVFGGLILLVVKWTFGGKKPSK